VNPVVIAGVGITRFGKFPELRLRDLVAEAVGAALSDASLTTDAIEAVYFGNAASGLLTGQEMIRGQVELQPTGIAGVPVFNIENACASSSSALHLAWQAVAAGATRWCQLGAEKMTEFRKKPFFVRSTGALMEAIDLQEDGDTRSPFMDVHADMTRRYQERFPATPQDFASLPRRTTVMGPSTPSPSTVRDLSVEQVLQSRPIPTADAVYVFGHRRRCRCGGRMQPRRRPPFGESRHSHLRASVVLSGLGARETAGPLPEPRARLTKSRPSGPMTSM
jgi:acetyl-CoA acetyltransferase